LHSRKNARIACLDTHVLKWLSYYTGQEIPKQTPTKNKYLELEKFFLNICDVMKTTPAELDLKIWNKQRGSDDESLVASAAKKKAKVLDC
jgi:thermostable 8-oxoguanine DNA glycosylase